MEPMDPNLSLELSPEQMEELLGQVTARLKTFLATLPDQPAVDVDGAEELTVSIAEQIPRSGTPFPELLELLFDRLIPKSFNTAGPGYLAYIPGGGIPATALASLIADVVNRYVGVWAAAPALAQLESTVGRWLCDIVSYPREARGLLTSGGSMSNLIAIVTARRARLPLNFLAGILYMSDQTHYSVGKAALLAGFPESSIRLIPSNSSFRIDLRLLREAIRADRERGLLPFLIVGNAGTTNTGAVDDLSQLVAVAREERLWLHVDAAYGGFFMLTDRGRATMKGIEQADSITLDPHKGLFLPYGTGSLVVRNGVDLKRAHNHHADYLPAMQEDDQRVDLCQVSPELSRAFRGLRVWLPLKLHGVAPFVQNLEEKLALADWIAEQLRRLKGIEIIAEPQLSLLAFRVHRPECSEKESDNLTRRLLTGVNARKRVYLSSAVVKGRYAARICVLSFRTHLDRLQMALEDIRAALENL
jgi:aromatic-L-amino-acid decarboxylase